MDKLPVCVLKLIKSYGIILFLRQNEARVKTLKNIRGMIIVYGWSIFSRWLAPEMSWMRSDHPLLANFYFLNKWAAEKMIRKKPRYKPMLCIRLVDLSRPETAIIYTI